MARPKRTSPTSDTRVKLIDGALAVAARNGLGATNVKSIAAAAGVASGLLHYHFASKDEVLLAAVERAGEDYVAAIDAILANVPPERALAAYTAFAGENMADHRALFQIRLALKTRAMHEPELAAKLGQGDRAAVGKLAEIVARHRGRARPTVEDRTLARTMKAAFEGFMLAWLSSEDFDMDQCFAIFARMVRDYLD